MNIRIIGTTGAESLIEEVEKQLKSMKHTIAQKGKGDAIVFLYSMDDQAELPSWLTNMGERGERPPKLICSIGLPNLNARGWAFKICEELGYPTGEVQSEQLQVV